MPGPSEILTGLARAADAGFLLAVAWHVAIAVALLAGLAGWRPSRRQASLLLSLPLVSVSAVAWVRGNPFNGAAFAALAVVLAALGARAPRLPVAPGPRWARAAGGALIAFAWLYPHFLDDWPIFAYVAGAPVGVIPCPTLALVAGFELLAGAPGGRARAWTVAGAALFYGVTGVAQLGVWLDGVLIAGAVAVALSAVPRRAKNAPAA